MYNQELNDKLDATIEGANIKKQFTKVERVINNLINSCEASIEPDGEFTNPVLKSFTDEEKVEMLAYINAILDLSKPFIEIFGQINKKEV